MMFCLKKLCAILWLLAAITALLNTGCGEHPLVKEREEFRHRIRSFQPPQEVLPETKPAIDNDAIKDAMEEALRAEADLSATRDQLAAVERQLAAATKGGFTGCKVYCTVDCLPCVRLEAALNKAGWTVGTNEKAHFWKIITNDKKAHPYVPHLVYWNDGRQMKGEIVGFDGSAKALAEIIAKHPIAHKGKPEARNAAVATGQSFASVEQEVFPPPAPPSEDVEYTESIPAMQVGCGAPSFARSDCGGFTSGCAAPSFSGCSAPVSYGCGASQSYRAYQTYSYQPQSFYGVQLGNCIGGVCY